MNKPLITIDIDGVIFNTPDWTVDSFNKKNDTSHAITELFDHNAKHNKSILVDSEDHFHATQKRKELYVLNPGCEQALITLSKNYELKALTSRNYDEFHEVTDELMKLHVADFISEVVYTTKLNDATHKEKGEIAKELGAVLHIDDSVEYCLSCQNAGIPAILFTQPYNKSYGYDPSFRAENWSSIPAIVANLDH